MIKLEDAHAREARYLASESVRDSLKRTSLLAMVGGIAVGKNYLMEESHLPITGTETTRSPRPDDNPARYTYSTREEMLEAIESGQLVQYGVALPHHIYGSRLRDYTLDTPNITDIWASSVAPLGNKGFENVRSVSVFSSREQWMSQLVLRTDRMQVGDIEYRLSEARHSLRWSLAKHFTHAADHLIIINGTQNVDDNLERIYDFAHGKNVAPLSDHTVDDAATQMNKVIETMYTRLSA